MNNKIKNNKIVESNKKKNTSLIIGIILITIIILSCLIGPELIGHDPNRNDLTIIFSPPVWEDGGDWNHILGTDQLGRDILTRIFEGGKISLLLGFVANLLGMLIGVSIGLISVFTKKWMSVILMRIVDLQMAFPYILLVLAIMTVAKPSIMNLIILLALAGWATYARVVRGFTLAEVQKEYVQGGIVIGASKSRLSLRYVLPSMLPTVSVLAILTIAAIILFEATLSFLGMGIQPPQASWGSMLFEARSYIYISWWYITFPGIAIFFTVLSLNLISDALRDIFDVRLK